MPGDLHNHTTYSDGSVPVARLPLMAARVGLDAMAISDHDTLRSVQYAYDHPVQDGVKLIPATELTGYDYERQHRVHLLAYWPDPESEALRRHCDIMRQRRNECCFAERPGAGSHLSPVPHRAGAGIRQRQRRALSRAASCRRCGSWALPTASTASATMSCSAGTRGAGCLHSPDVHLRCGRCWPQPEAAGAVVVFAHPTVYKSMPLLRELVRRRGWWTALRCDHPRNSPEDKAECAALCGQHHLIDTGGTDFHGANHEKVYPVGTCTTPDDQIARIEELARKRRR